MHRRKPSALISLLTSCLLLLSACGGGGGGGEGTAAAESGTPPLEPGVFSLRDAYAAYVAIGSTTNMMGSVTTGGVNCAGLATLNVAPQQAANFRGTAVLDSRQTLSLNLTACDGKLIPGGPVLIATTSNFHLNTTRSAVLGITDESGEDAVARAGGVLLPERMRVGDIGTLGVLDNFLPGATAPYGTTTITYSVATFGAQPRIILTYESADTGQPANYREIHNYELTTEGSLRVLTIQADDLTDGSRMYLVPNGP